MLDDLRKIHERDKEDALGTLANGWRYLATDMPVALRAPNSIANVVCIGMGDWISVGFALARSSILQVPLESIYDYEIPSYANDHTMVVVFNYAFETPQLVGAIEHAVRSGAYVVMVAEDGALVEITSMTGDVAEQVPGHQMLFSVFWVLRMLVAVLQRAGVCNLANADLIAAADFVHQESETWLPTVPTARNLAKQLSLECMGKSIVIYAGPHLMPAAQHWKSTLNECSRQIAWYGIYPGLSYDEFAGWSGQPEKKPYALLELRSGFDELPTKRQFNSVERHLSGMRPLPTVVEVKGRTLFEQLLWAIALGGFSSTYLALLNGHNPMSVAMLEKFKRGLREPTDEEIE